MRKTTKKTIVGWGTEFHFPNTGWIKILGKTKKDLERAWYRMGPDKIFDPKKCQKVKVTKL